MRIGTYPFKMLFAMAAATVFLFTGCSKVPQEEINSAKAAIDSARAVQADVYSKLLFRQAQDSLNAALRDIEKKKNGVPIPGMYEMEKTRLVAAGNLALTARGSAVNSKKKVCKEADSLLVEVRTAVEEATMLLSLSFKGKAGKALRDSFQTELNTIETGIKQASTAFVINDFLTARDKARGELLKVDSITNELKKRSKKEGK